MKPGSIIPTNQPGFYLIVLASSCKEDFSYTIVLGAAKEPVCEQGVITVMHTEKTEVYGVKYLDFFLTADLVDRPVLDNLQPEVLRSCQVDPHIIQAAINRFVLYRRQHGR